MARFLALFFVLSLALFGFSLLRAASSTPWQDLGGGLEMKILRVPAGAATVPIVAFRCDADKIRVATGAYTEAPTWREKFGARVAVNGGYFDGKGVSMGLRVADGKTVQKLRGADWGVFYVRRGRAQIVHSRDFSPQTRADEAVQCGPRLVVKGQTTDLKKQFARRTGLGIQKDGRVVVAIADGNLLFSTWAEQWAARDGLNCPDALNLDGGGSTQMALQTDKRRASISGAWPVPDAILIR